MPAFRWIGLFLAVCSSVVTGESAVDAPHYAGTAVCEGCHQDESRAWRGSHHDLAMQSASEDTVLGDFDDVRFEHQGVVTRFFRRDGRFMVATQGGDGESHDYEIAYTFGVTPLQQYLIGMPDGRFQALTVAWDSRPSTDGGQRWFHLYPDDTIPPGDELHWTAPAHTWNYACAECHSTDLRKNYDPETDTYATEWSDIDVGCESCHGPGARHVALAQARTKDSSTVYPPDHGLDVALSGPGDWSLSEGAPTAVRLAPNEGIAEVELCGRCHARRQPLTSAYVHGGTLSDTHRVELLNDGRYFSDGQILDEVYVYGSFLQSRMHAAGVTCSDCHEPHSLKLRAEGNALCSRCHSAERYDVPSHHHHEQGSAGAFCVECHMPERTYMVVDPRRDHSMRVPRPDLSVAIGVPNACTRCHASETDAWAAEALQRWYGKDRDEGFQRFAQALEDGRRGNPGTGGSLGAVALDPATPAIARATALAGLSPYLDESTLPALRAGLAAEDPLMRRGAVEALFGVDRQARWQLLEPLLDDPVLSVRVALGDALADIGVAEVPEAHRPRLRKVFDDYVAAQRSNADRVEHRVNLGNFFARQGDTKAAIEAYERAVVLDRRFVPAYVNMADLYRAAGRDADAGEALRAGIEAVPTAGVLRHAEGLWLARAGRTDEAVTALAKAWELAPQDSSIGYVYAVALDSTGDRTGAIAVWESVLGLDPNHRDTLYALVAALEADGQTARALLHAWHLARLAPKDSDLQHFIDRLKAGVEAGAD